MQGGTTAAPGEMIPVHAAVLSLCVTQPGLWFVRESFPWHRDPLLYPGIRIPGSGTGQEEPRAVTANSSGTMASDTFGFFFFG